jgi:hypothetical protein
MYPLHRRRDAVGAGEALGGGCPDGLAAGTTGAAVTGCRIDLAAGSCEEIADQRGATAATGAAPGPGATGGRLLGEAGDETRQP